MNILQECALFRRNLQKPQEGRAARKGRTPMRLLVLTRLKRGIGFCLSLVAGFVLTIALYAVLTAIALCLQFRL